MYLSLSLCMDNKQIIVNAILEMESRHNRSIGNFLKVNIETPVAVKFKHGHKFNAEVIHDICQTFYINGEVPTPQVPTFFA